MGISTRLTGLLRVEHPILLAPMDVVADGKLAATVSRAGGFGIIGGGYGNEAWLTRELDAAGNARVGVGFITWSMAKNTRLLDLALERKPAAIMLSFGDVRPHADRIKKAGALMICQVQTVAQAKDAVGERRGCAGGARRGGGRPRHVARHLRAGSGDRRRGARHAGRGGGRCRGRARACGRADARRRRRAGRHALLRHAGGDRGRAPRRSASSRRAATRPSAASCSTSRAAMCGPRLIRAACCATNSPNAGAAARPN